MTEPTNEPTDETSVLRPLGTDPRGRVGFIVDPEADPEDLAAALRAIVEERAALREGEAADDT